MTIETPLDERIEAARAQLQTAWNILDKTSGYDKVILTNRHNKWLQRKEELKALLDQQNKSNYDTLT